MSDRTRLVEIARAELGKSDAKVYWRDALGSTWVGPFPPHWCGAFALWCLRQAGLTDWRWEVGKGFLWRLARTTDPQPGDIGYVDQPFQHHFVVERADRHTLSSIDGNQGKPGVQRRSRAAGKHTYFSIAALLESPKTDPAPPPGRPTLRLGSHGDDVLEFQRLLAAVGFPALKVDGHFGPITANVLMQFQRRAGLPADAVCGPKTWAALEAASG